MSKTVKINNVGKAILETLTEYREDIEEDIEENVDKITKDAVNELKEISPKDKNGKKRKNPYYKGWSRKVQKKGRYKYSKVIWNKTNYQLTHILEFDHTSSKGKRIKGIPHIRPVEKKYKERFVDLTMKSIKRRGK